MKMHEITFKLDHTEKIVVPLQEDITALHCCYDLPIFFLHGNNECMLSNDSIHDAMYSFSRLLDKALAKKLSLPLAITEDIGYIINEQMNNDNSQTYPEITDYWLWSIAGVFKTKMNSWIYNDHDGAIILEITPSYPWNFENAEKNADFVPYEEWIKKYKPYAIRKIPASVARGWLDQANNILEQIEKNIATLRKEGKF